MSIKVKVDYRLMMDPAGGSGSFNGFSNGSRVFEVEGKAVGECLNKVVEIEPRLKSNIFDQDGELNGTVFLTLNGSGLLIHRLEKELKEGDEIGVDYGGGG